MKTGAIRPSSRGFNYLTWAISFVLAVCIWAYVNRIRTEERVLDANVELQFSRGWELASPVSRTVKVTLSGPRDVMEGLQSDQLRFSQQVEVSDSETGSVFTRRIDLKGDMLLGLPQEVVVRSVSPSSIELRLARLVKRYVKVEVVTKGQPAPGFDVGRIMYEPHYVPVWATADSFTGDEVVKSTPLDLTGKNEFFSRTIGLQPLRLNGKVIEVQDSLFAQVDIIEKKESRVLENVPVRLLLGSPLEKIGSFVMAPAQVNVTIEGRPDLVKALALSAITIYVDTRDLGTSAQGTSVLKCNALAQDGITVLSVQPDEVTWTSKPAETASAAPATAVVPTEKANAVKEKEQK